MSVKLLIDGVVQQTTVLIAQLSTAAGIRAPLSHVADQVFLSLAREIEAQGVGRKVAADMFGMALRAYQIKVQRLTESATTRDKTLWETVLEFVTEQGPVVRSRVLDRFSLDGERETIAVLTDLVNSGLIYASGRGAASIYNATSATDRERISREADENTRLGMVWGQIYRNPGIDEASLRAQVRSTEEELTAALAQLMADGRVEMVPNVTQTGAPTHLSSASAPQNEPHYRATNFLVPVGTDVGWESAVLDHFQAVTRAIAAKLSVGKLRSDTTDTIGGSTLRFQITGEHPHRQRVLGTLSRVRAELNALWQEVSDYNDAYPIDPEERVDVCFYYGQSVHGAEPGDDDSLPRAGTSLTKENH